MIKNNFIYVLEEILLKDIIYNDGDGKEISNALNNLKKIDKDGKFGFK